MNNDTTPYPQTQFLRHLTKAEQLELIMSHPLFTGRCPRCAYEFPKQPPLVHFDCPKCHWVDDSI